MRDSSRQRMILTISSFSGTTYSSTGYIKRQVLLSPSRDMNGFMIKCEYHTWWNKCNFFHFYILNSDSSPNIAYIEVKNRIC